MNRIEFIQILISKHARVRVQLCIHCSQAYVGIVWDISLLERGLGNRAVAAFHVLFHLGVYYFWIPIRSPSFWASQFVMVSASVLLSMSNWFLALALWKTLKGWRSQWLYSSVKWRKNLVVYWLKRKSQRHYVFRFFSPGVLHELSIMPVPPFLFYYAISRHVEMI